MNKQKLKEDLTFLIDNLEKIHPNPYFKYSREEFTKDLYQRLEEPINLNILPFEIKKDINKLGDSHTKVRGIEEKSITYPIKIKILENKIYIVGIERDKKEYIGSQIKKVNNIDIEEIKELFSILYPNENKPILNKHIEENFNVHSVLQYLDIIKEKDSLKIVLEGNKEIEIKTSNITIFTPREEKTLDILTLKHHGIYWTNIYKDISTYYLQYNECEDIKESEIHKIINEIKKSHCKYIVIDLRNNPGGSSLILDPLTKFLYNNQKTYTPVVFLSEKTFSAAIINALNTLDGRNSISIGTPTSGAPTKYGATKKIVLPNTNILVTISSKYFEEPGYLFGESLSPTIEVKQTINEYLQGRDSEWEMFLNHFELQR